MTTTRVVLVVLSILGGCSTARLGDGSDDAVPEDDPDRGDRDEVPRFDIPSTDDDSGADPDGVVIPPADEPASPDPGPESAVPEEPATEAPADDPPAEDPEEVAPEAPLPDDDQDGLADAREAEIAEGYMPFLSVSSDDECPAAAVLYRVRPHPDDARLVHVVYVVLYNDDCGMAGHPGDDEVFAAAIDPARPAPEGILAMVAIAHQGTLCETETRCETCGPDGNTCSTAEVGGADWPVVFVSHGKHGNYLKDGIGFGRCDGNCFFADECDQAELAAEAPMLNAGEPEHPLTRDLTDAGLVTAEHGFQDELLHFDPWSGESFGDAGVVADDLVDPAFDVPIPEEC